MHSEYATFPRHQMMQIQCEIMKQRYNRNDGRTSFPVYFFSHQMQTSTSQQTCKKTQTHTQALIQMDSCPGQGVWSETQSLYVDTSSSSSVTQSTGLALVITRWLLQHNQSNCCLFSLALSCSPALPLGAL